MVSCCLSVVFEYFWLQPIWKQHLHTCTEDVLWRIWDPTHAHVSVQGLFFKSKRERDNWQTIFHLELMNLGGIIIKGNNN